jgi:hypothetical protein
MKSLRTITAVALAVCLCASLAQAGNIGVYFDNTATNAVATKPVNQMFNMYICLTDVQNMLTAVEYKVNLPAELIVLGESFAGNFHNGSGSSSGVQVGLGDCVILFQPTDVLVVSTMQAITLQPFATRTITVSQWPLPNGGSFPRYSTCGAEPQLIDLAPQEAQLTAAVAADSESWGAVKALFE